MRRDSRASRKRADLLASFDTLSSHLQTTFTALSTAFARKIKRADDPTPNSGVAKAFLAIVVGPSAGSARARVVYAIDGLEVKLWGERDVHSVSPPAESPPAEDTDDEDTEDESAEESSSAEEASGSESDSDDEESGSGYDSVLDSDSVLHSDEESDSESPSVDSIIDDDTPPSPPASRSPSPECSSAPSRPASPKPNQAAQRSQASENSSPMISHQDSTYAASQTAIRAAERLLSRTLACSCAEDGGGMSAELAPTQTHILLRAPRRFTHPSWTPKMGVARAMDGLVEEFLEDSGFKDRVVTGNKAKKRKGAHVEGVWIRCRSKAVSGDDVGAQRHDETEDENDNGNEEEEDELIWWTWDGKLVGFTDW
ncbi:hypothetical protein HWV62_10895 [Athelia sp. TMB]|nr:hypothetical protein HWV62_10895 [Athelia sp. TMB]